MLAARAIGLLGVARRLKYFEQLSFGLRALHDDSFKLELDHKIRALNSDGLHEEGSRQRILQRYYDAFLRVEELATKSLPEKIEDGLSFFYIPTDDDKAKGVAIIVKRDEKTVGRFFMAEAPLHDHLSLLCVKNDSVREELITAKMFELYFKNKGISGKAIHSSCVGFYGEHLAKLGADKKYELVDLRGRPNLILRGKELNELSQRVISGEYKPIYDFKPSTNANPLEFTPVLKPIIERDLE